MNNRLYAGFDEVNIGVGLSLADNDLTLGILSTNPTNLDGNRLARSLYSTLFPGYVEMIVYNPDGTTPTLAGVRVGICTIKELLTNAAGKTNESIALDMSSGNVMKNNASLGAANTASPAFGVVIGILCDPLKLTVNFSINGNPGTNYTLPNAGPWFFAATLLGTNGNYAIRTNVGQTPFRYPPTGTYGWWSPKPISEQLNLATEPYMSQSVDTRRHEKFRGDINAVKNDIQISDSVNFPWWGASAPAELGTPGLVQMSVDDKTGKKYTSMSDDSRRDTVCQLYRIPDNSSFDASASIIFTGTFDHCDLDSRRTKQVYFRDYASRLNIAMRRAMFAPDADPTVAGKPRPISLGVDRNYEAILEKSASNLYALADGAISAVGRFRVAGKQIVWGVDVSPTADSQGVTYATAPIGVPTCETSSYGVAVSPTLPDKLAGSGVFTSVTANGLGQPTGWHGTRYGGGSTWQVQGVLPNKYIEMPQDADGIAWFAPDTPLVLLAGRSYGIEIDVTAIPYIGNVTDQSSGTVHKATPGQLVFGCMESTNIAFLNFGKLSLSSTGALTAVFTNNTAFNQNFVMGILFNEVVQGTGFITSFFRFTAIKIFEYAALATNISLGGPGFTDMTKAICVDRGPLDVTELAIGSLRNLDAQTGYIYGVHYSPDEVPTVAESFRSLCTSAGVAPYFDEIGQLYVGRLYKPESVDVGDVDHTLNESHVVSELQVWPDMAENLTTRVRGCRNYRPISPSEYGDTTLNDTPTNVRAQLAQQYQWEATANVQLAVRYQTRAQNRAPLLSLLDVLAHGQDLANYMAGLYGVGRSFYVAEFDEPLTRFYKLLQSVNLTYGYPDLLAGKNLVIVGRQRRPNKNRCKLVLWG
jgi:hypothetical protein